LPAFLQRLNPKLLAAFFAVIATLVAQDPTSYLTKDVLRVGDRLACRCGTCRNTVGTCPMLRCDSAYPMRQRIYNMKQAGMSDDAIVSRIVREEGVVALSAPPATGFGGVVTWVMPGVALLVGFFIYSFYVRRNRKQPEPLSAGDCAVIDRFQEQIDRELEDSPKPGAPT
jgi:cytochrome c-type biogenesis protein CcmH/NrfF